MPKPKGECVECGLWYALLKDGTVRAHLRVWTNQECAGSLRPPRSIIPFNVV